LSRLILEVVVCIVSARNVMAAARGILMSFNHSRLVEFAWWRCAAEQAVGLHAFEKNELRETKGNNSQEDSLKH
jgi:hypothetical protein